MGRGKLAGFEEGGTNLMRRALGLGLIVAALSLTAGWADHDRTWEAEPYTVRLVPEKLSPDVTRVDLFVLQLVGSHFDMRDTPRITVPRRRLDAQIHLNLNEYQRPLPVYVFGAAMGPDDRRRQILPIRLIYEPNAESLRMVEARVPFLDPDDFSIAAHSHFGRDRFFLDPETAALGLALIQVAIDHDLVVSEPNRLRLYGILAAAARNLDVLSIETRSSVFRYLESLVSSDRLRDPGEYRRRLFRALAAASAESGSTRLLMGEKVRLRDEAVRMMGLLVDQHFDDVFAEVPYAQDQLLLSDDARASARMCLSLSRRVFAEVAERDRLRHPVDHEILGDVVDAATVCIADHYRYSDRLRINSLRGAWCAMERDRNLGRQVRDDLREMAISKTGRELRAATKDNRDAAFYLDAASGAAIPDC